MDEIEKLKVISLISRLTNELTTYTGVNDKALAEFVLDIHSSSKSLADFKTNVKEAGAELPDDFIANLDRIIRQLHPHPAKFNDASNSRGSALKEKEKKFKGLALPDSRQHDEDVMDEALNQLKGIATRSKPQFSSKRTRSRSPPPEKYRRSKRQEQTHHRRQSYSQDDRYSDDDRRGRSHRRSRRDRSTTPDRRRERSATPERRRDRRRRDEDMDDEPVLGKIYNGRVVNMTNFGAFVALEGIRGKLDGKYNPLITS